MRKILFALLSLLTVAIGFNSCTDDVIGPSISDIHSAVIEDASFVINGVTVRSPHLRSRSSIQLIGKVSADDYGTLTSDVVAQFMPTTTIDTVGVHGGDQWLDSCFVVMRVSTTDVIGDKLAPMRMSVYKLNKQLPNPIYTDFNPAGYYSDDELMGEVTYSASDLSLKTEYSSING